MSWTYDPALAEEKDQVRFLVQDVNTNKQLFQDEEIDWALTQDANIFMVAANLCESLVVKAGGGVKFKKISDFSVAYNADFYRGLASSLRARGMGHQVPYAGGISIADKEAVQENTDWVPAAISRGQGDNPEAPKPIAPPVNPLVKV